MIVRWYESCAFDENHFRVVTSSRGLRKGGNGAATSSSRGVSKNSVVVPAAAAGAWNVSRR